MQTGQNFWVLGEKNYPPMTILPCSTVAPVCCMCRGVLYIYPVPCSTVAPVCCRNYTTGKDKNHNFEYILYMLCLLEERLHVIYELL